MPRIKKPKVCSECGSKKIATIVAGYPPFSEKDLKDAADGKIVFGGCVVSEDDPRWQCVECGKAFPELKQLPVGD
jgi:hypothetical protein